MDLLKTDSILSTIGRILYGGNRVINYFVQQGEVHTYPVGKGCLAQYSNEWLFDIPPTGTDKCKQCFSHEL